MSARLPDIEVDALLSQGEHFAQLFAHPAWAAWTAHLHAFRQSALEELAQVTDSGDFRYWQGVAGALGELLDRPTRIIQAADSIRQSEEEERGAVRVELRQMVGLGVQEGGEF